MSTEEFRHKLSSIFSADVVGYSRLMRDDEEATIRTLTTYRKVMTHFIQKYRGRVVDAVGDNLLAEFASAADSVKCAVEIQRKLFEQNAELPDKRKMRFRIGLNHGDVVEKEQRIYGDGVNIAARMESLADKGGICISGNVYDQVKQKLDLKYNYLGEQKIKNIKEPVRAYWVLSLPGTAAHRFIKAKLAVNKTWRNVIVAATVVLIIGAASAIGKFYSLPKFPVEKISDQSGKVEFLASDKRKALEAIKRREKELKMEIEEQRIAAERKRIEEERKALEAKKRQEETLRLEMEKQKIAAERKRIDEEKKALEAKIKQEESRKKQLAYIPKTASKRRDEGIVYYKPHGDNRYSLAVIPFCESAIAHTQVDEQKEFTDFMIKYTNNIRDIVFTHSYYPYHEYKTEQQLRRINSIIHEDLEREIWYGNSKFPREKPDYKVLKKLAKKINSDLILTFKISATPTYINEMCVTYKGYLIDIDKNIDYEKIHRRYYNEQTICLADFDILKQMTKDLFELYLNSNPQARR
jgi:class 3 adenylate cyclase